MTLPRAGLRSITAKTSKQVSLPRPLPLILARPLSLLTFPGVDFFFPYWMARYHGFFEDDASGTCLRWLPISAS